MLSKITNFFVSNHQFWIKSGGYFRRSILPSSHFGLVSRPLSSQSHKTSSDYDFDITLNIQNTAQVLKVHPIWLRHHCMCEKCFNPKTFQKMLIPSNLPGLSQVSDINTSSKNDTIQIIWKDGHQTTFDLKWLQRNYPSSSIAPNSLKNANPNLSFETSYENIQQTPSDPLANAVSYSDLNLGNDSGVTKLLENVVKYGYGIVKDAPPDFESTKKVVLKISHPQNTIYGDFSEWTSNLEHADTAYTSDFVHLHTDTSYFSEPMGLQMFHCLKHEGTGGINSIVDGFNVAKQFRNEFSSLHSTLSQVVIPSQYLDPGKHHFHNLDVILKHKFSGLIDRVRYNPHDMGLLNTIPFQLIPQFYKSLVAFSAQIESQPTWIKLTPGLIIFLDNWRVLHGRSEFTGFRHLCGAYISRSDWLSKARVLGIIP